jgi:hypothetical protein
LPDTGNLTPRTPDDPSWVSRNPPKPAIVMGQAPDVDGTSWGDYAGWEEFKGIIRGIQFHSGLLSLTDIQAEIDTPMSTPTGQNHVRHLNLNHRPCDVADRRGRVPHTIQPGRARLRACGPAENDGVRSAPAILTGLGLVAALVAAPKRRRDNVGGMILLGSYLRLHGASHLVGPADRNRARARCHAVAPNGHAAVRINRQRYLDAGHGLCCSKRVLANCLLDPAS